MMVIAVKPGVMDEVGPIRIPPSISKPVGGPGLDMWSALKDAPEGFVFNWKRASIPSNISKCLDVGWQFSSPSDAPHLPVEFPIAAFQNGYLVLMKLEMSLAEALIKKQEEADKAWWLEKTGKVPTP